ncbi:SAM-dependent methyltransferase [Streptomyces sp. NPDC102476]|uniref:SAM-dependent methyltransferase n=1 Tax=Streptomyces sp. NPDC102476 TaxID=3366181 RepID=UPI00382703AE
MGGARVVYVDNDPIVLAHARALLISTPSQYPRGRHRLSPGGPARGRPHLTAAQETLDLSQPVGLMLVAVLQYVPDADDPHGITRRSP